MRILPSILLMGITSLCVVSVSAADRGVKRSVVLQTQDVMQSAVEQLRQYTQLQQTLQIQDPDLASAMKKSLLMADLLFGADGMLDLAKPALVKAAFITADPEREEYEENMERILNQLDASWQQMFNTITAPQRKESVEHLVLRALFSLAPDENVTDRHARVAVLAAMLAPYNQGPVGDCFAVAGVVRDHLEDHKEALEDYKAIVMHGKLERPVDNQAEYFFFLPVLADMDKERPFSLTASGTFVGSSFSLFDAPGFAAARKVMGGESLSVKEVLPFLNNLTRVTASEVISAMAEALAIKSNREDVEVLRSLAAYGFSSLTNNPILRGVEAAYAAMAEDRPQDSTRSNINGAIDLVLQQLWKRLGSLQNVDLFRKQLMQIFNASYRLVYNLDIPLAQVSADGSSSSGGFQMFERVPGAPSELGSQIETPEQLRQCILNAVVVTASALRNTPQAQTIAYYVQSLVQTDEFLAAVLWAYDPANQQEADPIGNYRTLPRTPMKSCDGDNPFEVNDIDMSTMDQQKVQGYTPNNATDLIMWCLNLAKQFPSEFLPMVSPQHAFNFSPMNPDLMAFNQSGMRPSQWLQKKLILPGMQVAGRQISIATQQAVAQGMQRVLAHVLPAGGSYEHFVQTLMQYRLSVQGYAQNLLNGINILVGANDQLARNIALVLDKILLQYLPASDIAILEQSSIRFASTNWNMGVKDIYFCAFFNPRTAQIGFGTILEDKTHLQPMDEDAWVNHQPWGVEPVSIMALVANE